MKDGSNSGSYSDEEFADKLVKVGAAAIIFAMFVVVVYLFWFNKHKLSTDPADWGAFGDYIGGLVNPVVGLATVILVIFSISIQRRELRASLQEMKHANEAASRMSFEQSFFTWLSNYQSLLTSIKVDNHQGRQFLQWLYENHLSPRATIDFLELPIEIREVAQRSPNEAYMRIDVPGRQGLKQVGEFFFRAVLRYQFIFLSHKSDLSAPIRTLYRLIRWIDQSSLTTAEKWHYCALVRSQLSWVELVFLFYNGLIVEGEKFSEYANKYALFDDLGTGDFLLSFAEARITTTPLNEHPRLRDGDRLWPYLPSAFSSKQAKLALGLPEMT